MIEINLEPLDSGSGVALDIKDDKGGLPLGGGELVWGLGKLCLLAAGLEGDGLVVPVLTKST